MRDLLERRFEVVEELAQSLIDSQFPAWSHLPLKKIDSAGTDNSIYRLGKELALRFPVSVSAAEQVAKEHRWLPKLSSFAAAIPIVVGAGRPTNEYPFPWSVMNWIEGKDAASTIISDWLTMADDLGQFVRKFRGQNTSGAPVAGKHNGFRGTALVNLDQVARNAMNALEDTFDKACLLKIWEQALGVEPWAGSPVWIHGDIHAANIIVRNDGIAGIIDFGLMGIGDPACDLALGWSLLPPRAREIFRTAANVDEPTWQRGKGWGLYIGVIALSYYRDRNPTLSGIAEKAIRAVIEDSRSEQ
jgi:aminoglycoside phosphotransferase (APT) family kinase protein